MCGGTTTTVAPAENAEICSKTDASKLEDENRSIRESVSIPSSERWSAVNALRPRWVTTTPFGVPVEPDV